MGYSERDKVLITHIDDIGFAHAANVAAFECLDVGAASYGSILTAGPWFQEAAEICRARPGYDVGVHLTLTCEYPTYRWPALSSRDPSTGLLDEQGYLWKTREDAVRHVTVLVRELTLLISIRIWVVWSIQNFFRLILLWQMNCVFLLFCPISRVNVLG